MDNLFFGLVKIEALFRVRKKTRCLIRKGQSAQSSENTEFRQGGMSSFCCEYNAEMEVFLQTLCSFSARKQVRKIDLYFDLLVNHRFYVSLQLN